MKFDMEKKKVKLYNGVYMPILGFGTYQITDIKVCEESVLNAIDVGYRLIDTAASYRNEEAVGQAIKKSDVDRDELFITTKLWVELTGYEKTIGAFERSLNRLQLDYIDLYLIHQPYGDIHGSWRAMEKLYREGKIRAIGVANFYPDRLLDLIMTSEIPPMVNQVETHPFFQQVESQMLMESNNVQIESWGGFAEGKGDIFKNEILLSIAKKHGRTVAQVILRWLIQRNVIAIPKSVHKERIIENFDIFDFELDSSDMQLIRTLDKNKSSFFDHRDPEIVKWMLSRKLNV